MADTIIKKNNEPTSTDPAAVHAASFLDNADVNNDRKVSLGEMIDHMFESLNPAFQERMRKVCKTDRNVKDLNGINVPYILIDKYIDTMQRAAQIAVNNGTLDEVVMPTVPKLCERALAIDV